MLAPPGHPGATPLALHAGRPPSKEHNVDLGDFLWTLLAFYFIFFYFMILFRILADLFSDHETSGLAKTGWIIILLLVPFLAMFMYLITRGRGMTERAMAASQAAQSAQKDYIRQTAGTDPATQIANGQELLKTGAISQQEFDTLKTKALA
jgi:ABC-type multidrug transport system fused ATPase/permease subunit